MLVSPEDYVAMLTQQLERCNTGVCSGCAKRKHKTEMEAELKTIEQNEGDLPRVIRRLINKRKPPRSTPACVSGKHR